YSTLGQRDYLKQLKAQHPGADAEQVDAVAKRLLDQRLIAEDHYVSRQEWLELQKAIGSKEGGKLAANLPPSDALLRPNELVKFRTYHPVEEDRRVRVISLGVEEGFFIYMKTAVVFGAIIAGPFIFYFLWQFVAAGLYPHEQRYVHVFLPFSVGLFLTGAAL